MTTITIAEKRALEEVFICLEQRKRKRIECIKSYLMFYKRNHFFKRRRELPLIKN